MAKPWEQDDVVATAAPWEKDEIVSDSKKPNAFLGTVKSLANAGKDAVVSAVKNPAKTIEGAVNGPEFHNLFYQYQWDDKTKKFVKDESKIPPETEQEKKAKETGAFLRNILVGNRLAAPLKIAKGVGLGSKVAQTVARGAVENAPFAAEAAKDGDLKNAAAGVGVQTALDITLPVAGKVAKSAKTMFNAEKKLDNAIEKGVSKGIKPTVIGKPSLAKMEGFYKKAGDAVKTIADNRSAIKVVDQNGNPVSHPRTAAEMAQAIDQTKKIIYKKYNDMAVAAGDNGAAFDPDNIVEKLTELASPEGFYKGNKDARMYAASLIKDVQELKGARPEVIEERIREYNESLAGYFAGRADKVNARIDASIANALRQELDDKITNSVGEGYQALKNQYGSLKAIENEVNKRALVNARKNTKGIADLTDIFTGGDLIAGVMTMNPALIARGVAGRGIKEVFKSLNNPDRYIDQMFRQAYSKLPEPPVAPAGPNAISSALSGLESPAFARKGIKPDEMIKKDQRVSRDKLLGLPAPMVGTGQKIEPMLPTVGERVRSIGTNPPKPIKPLALPAPMIGEGKIEPMLPTLGNKLKNVVLEKSGDLKQPGTTSEFKKEPLALDLGKAATEVPTKPQLQAAIKKTLETEPLPDVDRSALVDALRALNRGEPAEWPGRIEKYVKKAPVESAPVGPKLNNKEGGTIASQLGVKFNGVQLDENDVPAFYVFTDPVTRGTIAAKTLDDAAKKISDLQKEMMPKGATGVSGALETMGPVKELAKEAKVTKAKKKVFESEEEARLAGFGNGDRVKIRGVGLVELE